MSGCFQMGRGSFGSLFFVIIVCSKLPSSAPYTFCHALLYSPNLSMEHLPLYNIHKRYKKDCNPMISNTLLQTTLLPHIWGKH